MIQHRDLKHRKNLLQFYKKYSENNILS
ncbi:hypothetical protein CHL72_08570, partial [Streptococcus pneumoniae]